jgi:hypothetical protein
MIKFDFIINSDIEKNVVKQINCKKNDMLKFHILVGNEINQISQNISSILKSSINSEQFSNFQKQNISDQNISLCRQCLNFVQISDSRVSYVTVNSNRIDSNICLQVENDNITSSVVNDTIYPINFSSQLYISFNALRNINQNDITQRLLNEIYISEDQLFLNLLKLQTPIEQYNTSVNSVIETLFESTLKLISYQLQSSFILMHPIMLRYLRQPQYSTALKLTVQPNTIFDIQIKYSNSIDQNEIYLLSSNIGEMYMFEDVQFTNIKVIEKINLAITRNFIKVRIC